MVKHIVLPSQEIKEESIEKSVSKQSEEDLEFRDEVNEDRLNILKNFKPPEEPVIMYRGTNFLQKRWWKFTKEVGVRLFSKNGWGGRRIYVNVSGTGQLLALGGAFSFGPSYGLVVVTLPMFEISFGYVR